MVISGGQEPIEAFTDGEGLVRLSEILRGLPEDIEDLYTNIWRRISKHRQGFARLLTLVKASEGPLNFLNLWLADEGWPQRFTGLDLANISNDRLSSLRSQLMRRLDSRTRGILELSKDDNVELLHRTTLDWANGKIWSETAAHLGSTFDPAIDLLHSEVLMSRNSDKDSFATI